MYWPGTESTATSFHDCAAVGAHVQQTAAVILGGITHQERRVALTKRQSCP